MQTQNTVVSDTSVTTCGWGCVEGITAVCILLFGQFRVLQQCGCLYRIVRGISLWLKPLHNNLCPVLFCSKRTRWYSHCEFASNAVIATYQAARCHKKRAYEFYTAVNVSDIRIPLSFKVLKVRSGSRFRILFRKVSRFCPFVRQVWATCRPAVSHLLARGPGKEGKMRATSWIVRVFSAYVSLWCLVVSMGAVKLIWN